ncbi:hypothetical protein BURMUCGD1_4914 [Burkholderia multivorans CGD1]|nr:hypothetical protein BURMUCGD1_4914 [Burkholderia multivorans CGD1]
MSTLSDEQLVLLNAKQHVNEARRRISMLASDCNVNVPTE